MYLWLEGRLQSWKFVARHLGLGESDLERIGYDYRGMSEQCFQMLLRWQQTFAGTPQCSYRRLGQVLRDSERNSHLYREYVEKFMTLEQLH